MKKTFCDSCGKEIQNKTNRITVRSALPGLQIETFNKNGETGDYCLMCIRDSINEECERLYRPKNKKK